MANIKHFKNLTTPKNFRWLEYPLCPTDNLEQIIAELEMTKTVLDFVVIHTDSNCKIVFEIKLTDKELKDVLSQHQLNNLTNEVRNMDIVNVLLKLCKLNPQFDYVIFCSNLAKKWISFFSINDLLHAQALGICSWVGLDKIMKVHPYSDFNFPIINSELFQKQFEVHQLTVKNQDSAETIKEYNHQLTQLKTENQNLQNQLKEIEQQATETEDEKSQLENQLEELQNKRAVVGKSIEQLQQEIADSETELNEAKAYLEGELSQNKAECLDKNKTQISNIASEIRRHNQFQYDNYATKRTLTGTLMSNAFPESLTDSLDFSVTKNVIGLLNLNKDESKLTNDEKTPPVVYLLIGQDKESSTKHPKFLMKIGSANNFYKRSVVYKTNVSEDNENNHFKMGSVVFLKNILIPRNCFNPLNNEWLIRHLFEKWLKKNNKTQLVDSKLGNEFFKYDINALQELDRIFENFKNNQYKYENELAEIDKAYQMQDNTMKRKLQNQFVKRHFDELI